MFTSLQRALLASTAPGVAAMLVLSSGPGVAHQPKRAQQAAAETVNVAHRIIVTDSGDGSIRVIDAERGAVILNGSVTSPARLSRGNSDRYVYAVQGAAGAVRPIDTGIIVDDHGDHADLKVRAPRLLDASVAGSRPSHFNAGEGLVAAFFDEEGAARVVREADFVAGKLKGVETVTTGVNHHGVAKPIGRGIAIGVPKEGENLPIAVEWRTRGAASAPRVDCARLHGEGKTGRFTAFGCADGVAVLEEARGGVTGKKLAYPASLPTGRMVRNFAGAAGFTLLAGDFGPDGMVIVDPTKEDGFQFVQLQARRMHFALDREHGDKLFVMLETGKLVKFNALTGAAAGEAQVTAAYSMEQGVARPRLSVSGDVVAVTNPAAGEVVLIDKESLRELRRVETGGSPFDVMVVGGKGHAH